MEFNSSTPAAMAASAAAAVAGIEFGDPSVLVSITLFIDGVLANTLVHVLIPKSVEVPPLI
jgi:hypothetical protein